MSVGDDGCSGSGIVWCPWRMWQPQEKDTGWGNGTFAGIWGTVSTYSQGCDAQHGPERALPQLWGQVRAAARRLRSPKVPTPPGRWSQLRRKGQTHGSKGHGTEERRLGPR